MRIGETYIPVKDKNGQYSGTFRRHRFMWQNRLHYWIKRILFPFVKKVLIWGTVLSTTVGISYAYAMSSLPTKVEYVREQSEFPPILKKIAKCESSDKHFSKEGVVLRGKVDPDDIGRYQINQRIWGQKAFELGLNIWDEKDNEAFALWLYKNYGSEPWKPTVKCFTK